MAEQSAPPAGPEIGIPEQIANRRVNRDRVAALGRPTYPNRYDFTHLVADVVATWSPLDAAAIDGTAEDARRVSVPGRVMALRRMGKKAAFVDLSDGRARVQSYLRADALSPEDWQLFETLDLGDHVGVTGVVF